MAEDKEQPPDSLLPYDEWVEAAMRQVAARAVAYAAANGLPGEHHFYSDVPHRPSRRRDPAAPARAVSAGDDDRPAAPVLGPEDWITRRGLISVGLSFGGVPATLVIPLGRADRRSPIPHIRYAPAVHDRPDPAARRRSRNRNPRPNQTPDREAGRAAAGRQPGCVPPPAAVEDLSQTESNR